MKNIKSYKKPPKGKVFFPMAIIAGYLCGINHEILYSEDIVFYFYILNLIMVSIDTVLYYRNKSLDKTKGICVEIRYSRKRG